MEQEGGRFLLFSPPEMIKIPFNLKSGLAPTAMAILPISKSRYSNSDFVLSSSSPANLVGRRQFLSRRLNCRRQPDEDKIDSIIEAVELYINIKSFY